MVSDLAYTPARLRSLPEGLPVTIRRADPGDAPAIAHLAEIDEAPVPAGELILAEVAGELWAAASLERDQGISDPFRPSGELLRALAERAGRRPCGPDAASVRRSGCSTARPSPAARRPQPPAARPRLSRSGSPARRRASGASSTTPRSASSAPSTSTSETERPDPSGRRLTTATTSRPSSSAGS